MPFSAFPSNFDELLSLASLPAVILDHHGAVVAVSDEARRWIGPEQEAIVGRRFEDLLVLSDRASFRGAFEKFSSDPRKMMLGEERELRLANTADPRAVSLALAPLRVADAQFVQVAMVDVTARVRELERLRQSESLFRTIVERSPELISVMTLHGTILYDSPSASHAFGWKPGERDRRSSEDFHPDDLTLVLGTLHRLTMDPLVPLNLRYRRLHKDGTWRWVDVMIVNLTDDPAVGACLLYRHEVTEEVRSAASLRLVLDNVAEGMAVADASGNFVLWNKGAVRLTGVDPRGARLADLGEKFAVYLADGTTRLPIEETPISRALRGETMNNVILAFRAPSGAQPTWVSVSARPLVSEELGLNGAVAVFRDVTQEVQANMRLLVSDRMASIGLLASGVAHEINNPLMVVLTNLDFVKSELADIAEKADVTAIERAVEDIATSAQRVGGIVADLKIFSRADSDAVEAVDVARLLETTLRLADNEIRHRARLVVDIGPVPKVRGSESRLVQAFLNLVVNAAQAIAPGAADKNEIRVRAFVSGREQVIIEVTDSGGGMSEEARAQLFVPFYTTRRDSGGTGLGLSICHRIVTGLGGTIDVKSGRGRGTTVRVALSQYVSDEVATADPPPVAPSLRAAVLIVDDDPLVCKALSRALEREHLVECETNGASALGRLRGGERFDLILCDVMMPTMTGTELHQVLERELPEVAARVVFISGEVFAGETQEYLGRVPNPLLEKPCDMARLRTLIRERIQAVPAQR